MEASSFTAAQARFSVARASALAALSLLGKITAEEAGHAAVQQSIFPLSADLRGISLPIVHPGMLSLDIGAATAATGANASPSPHSTAMRNRITRLRIRATA